MSLHEQGDVRIELERVATNGGDFSMYQGRDGVLRNSASPTFLPTAKQKEKSEGEKELPGIVSSY
jgi:hypothetical protein